GRRGMACALNWRRPSPTPSSGCRSARSAGGRIGDGCSPTLGQGLDSGQPPSPELMMSDAPTRSVPPAGEPTADPANPPTRDLSEPTTVHGGPTARGPAPAPPPGPPPA